MGRCSPVDAQAATTIFVPTLLGTKVSGNLVKSIILAIKRHRNPLDNELVQIIFYIVTLNQMASTHRLIEFQSVFLFHAAVKIQLIKGSHTQCVLRVKSLA